MPDLFDNFLTVHINFFLSASAGAYSRVHYYITKEDDLMIRRFFCILVLASCLLSAATADLPDLSGLSFDELVELRGRLNLAIWNSEDWQEVTVPAGVWQVGVDIPAGHWTIKPAPDSYVSVVYCDRLNEFGRDPAVGWRGWNGTLTARDGGITANEPREVDLDMVDGMYFINRGTVIFTPFAGKPDLGFQ